LEWLEISGIRGWSGQRVSLDFPFIAIAGENGAGKSTILQAIASVYRSKYESITNFPSQYFPDTPWDRIRDAKIAYQIRQGDTSALMSIQKPTDRWRETPDRKKRPVSFIDLRRIQAISSRVGYQRIAKAANTESRREQFSEEKLQRFSAICGRTYASVGFALSNIDENRWVPVASIKHDQYSGFHQGAGELAIAELLRWDIPRYGIVLIDEFETSLHPRAQRRLMRDMAEMCRVHELQIIVTTHSPYVLDELPDAGRMYVMSSTPKVLVTGVSPAFALTQMDDEPHPELDIYVEDDTARIMLEEIIVATGKELVRRCAIIPFGAASVGLALGLMVSQKRFPRPSLVFLDADQELATGCHLLPGDDAPERVVFAELKAKNWVNVAQRIGRPPSEVIDALDSAMTKTDHHEWIADAANRLVLGGNELWRALCSSWIVNREDQKPLSRIAETIQQAVDKIPEAPSRGPITRDQGSRQSEDQKTETEGQRGLVQKSMFD
jgi:predicted ATPase